MFRAGLRPPDPFRGRPVLETACTQEGISLHALASMSPVLVVCLPEAGPREAWLKRLGAQRPGIERAGVRIVLVQVEAEPRAGLDRHDLAYVARIADPERKLYAALGLGAAPPGLWRRLFSGGARPQPGAFLLEGGEVARAHRSRAPADCPSFTDLLQ